MNIKIYIKVPLVLLENLVFSIFPTLRPLIERYLFNPYSFNNKHLSYSISQFKNFSKKIIEHDFQLTEKNILELGPGGSIGFGLLVLKHGARKYFAIESISHTFITKEQMLSYQKILENNNELINKFFMQNEHGQYVYNPQYIEFIEIGQSSRYHLPDESVDVIYSCAVLEHVHNLDLCFSEMTRILRKGGIMNHQVDLRDHVFSQKSLWFLNFNDRWFDRLFKNTGEYVNRKRFSYYESMFKKNFLQIIKLEKSIVFKERLSEKLLAKYSENDLRLLSFNIILKKQ